MGKEKSRTCGDSTFIKMSNPNRQSPWDELTTAVLLHFTMIHHWLLTVNFHERIEEVGYPSPGKKMENRVDFH